MIMNFMLPTSASNAIIFDGSLLIIVIAIAMAYMLYKYKDNLTDTSLLPNFNFKMQDNHQYKFDVNNESLKDSNMNTNNVNRKSEEVDVQQIRKEPEKVLLE